MTLPISSCRPAKPAKREGYWYLVRRVPVAFISVEKRACVRISTGIRVADDPMGRAARVAVERLDQALTAYWRDLRAGKDPEAIIRHRRAMVRAQELGFPYLPVREVIALPLRDLAARLDLLARRRLVRRREDVFALLGGVEVPQSPSNTIPISELVNQVEAIISSFPTSKSAGQKRRWRSTQVRAATSLITAVGFDKLINDLTRQDALALRRYWADRALRGLVRPLSANKAIGAVASMHRTVSDHYQLDLPPIFDRLSFRTGDADVRHPFSHDFIQERLLSDDVLASVNAEARRILYLMIETGLRPSEACNLTRSTIALDHEIPHISVRSDGREIKTKSARRDIPLVGVSLMAMIAQPDGFPRYRDKADTLSATLNKFLQAKGLRSGGQTLYSIRHSFSDRLRNAKAPDSTVNYFMGHAHRGPKYGAGISLEIKLDWLRLIAFRPPSKI